MIDLYYLTTPNGHKITIFLEETNLPYSIKPINIGAGDQLAPGGLLGWICHMRRPIYLRLFLRPTNPKLKDMPL